MISRVSAPFQGRSLWATWVAGVAWTTVAILNAAYTVALLTIPYGFFDVPFTIIYALVAGYLARGILVRGRILIAIFAFFVALAVMLGALASGEVLVAAASSVVVASSLLAAIQLRRRDVAVARALGDPSAVMGMGGIARRIVIGLMTVALAIGGLWWGVSYGPLAGCRPEGPNELPNGAPAGQGIEGVSGEANQLVWGHAGDRIEELVGQDWFNPDDPDDIRVATISIHGHPGVLFALSPEINGGEAQLAFSWNNGSCDQTVLLVPGTSIESAEAYATLF